MERARGQGTTQGGASTQARVRAVPGMKLHQEVSRHAWREGEPALDLIVTLDDATGAIYSAFLVEEESTASTFRALKEVFSEHSLAAVPPSAA
jgi:hypothetical protein